ncbi:UDP-glycosyltransferase 92A1-like [Camellia sinensis]|uniref:UDP-glycosyltransferase 92A1-like n=1 Tax=Camellia sinensis TaxID=4442 RepID=UPI001036CBAF|nr:UDP-glycosyltransferase 92A1-like [Camellia sinensis]
MTERKENIVMFPFMAQGHIIPFLALALELEKKNGYTITFVNTRLNIKKLRSSIPPYSSIRLLEIPFNSSGHGLPPDSENTDSLPLPLLIHLIVISPALEPAFRDLISGLVLEHGRPPLCIISDMFFGWSAKVAHEFGAFHAIFNAGGGYGMAAFHSLWLHLLYKKVNSEEFPLPGFRKGHRIHTKQLPEHFQVAVPGDSWCSFLKDMFRDWLESDGILFNTTEEIDHVGMEYFRQQIGCSVWPVGPILSSLGSKARAGDDAEATMHLCMKWLDSKPANSVLYVAFGSQSAPSP